MSEGEAPSEKNRAFRFTTIKHYSLTRAPGICFCLVLVLASSYISEHYGITQILGALLLGMAFNSISRYDEFAPGLDFCVKNILRFGVALLGVRITFSQISALGAKPLLVVSVVVVTTLLFSVLLAKLLKVDQARGIISGAAVGICGVSAALAIASVIQSNKDTEKHVNWRNGHEHHLHDFVPRDPREPVIKHGTDGFIFRRKHSRRGPGIRRRGYDLTGGRTTCHLYQDAARRHAGAHRDGTGFFMSFTHGESKPV